MITVVFGERANHLATIIADTPGEGKAIHPYGRH
jgi:hypothetical protein